MICATKSLKVAQKYAARSGNRIVGIRLDQVPGPIMDLTMPARRSRYLGGNPVAERFAAASEEILIQGDVPSAAIWLVKGPG